MGDEQIHEYDVFISYTHLDNLPLSEGGEGWISGFHRLLEIRLGELLGRKANIWRDNKLRGNDEFADEIMEKFPLAKALVAVISPGYLQSKWCMKELRAFCRKAEESGGIKVGNKSRIFKAVKTPVPHEEHPDEIRGLLGYEFFRLDEKGQKRESRPEKSFQYYQEFLQKLDDLALDIRNLINALPPPPGPEVKPPPTHPPVKTVYLAETSSDLSEERDEIQRMLNQRGYNVLPDRALPYQLKDGNFKEVVKTCLEQCRLSIHLIGRCYGIVPEGEEHSVVELQNRLAGEASEQGRLKRLIWMPPDIHQRTEEDRQKAYIETLLDENFGESTDLLQNKILDDFKTVILDTLAEIAKPPPPPPGPPLLYLVYDREDKDTARVLGDCFYDEGLEVRGPLSTDDESQCSKLHREHLSIMDAMMIYYDRASEYWLTTMLNELRKAPGYREARPIRYSGVFITGEKTEYKEHFKTHDAKEVVKRYPPPPISRDLVKPIAAEIKKRMEATDA